MRKPCVWMLVVVASTALAACSAASDDSTHFGASGSPSGGGTGSAGGVPPPGSAGTLQLDPTAGMPSTGGSSNVEGCAAQTMEAKPTPTDLLVLLDQSGSMTLDGNRWAPTSAALKAFAQNQMFAGMGVGLQYFPLGATKTEDPKICVAGNYATPSVPIAALPGNSSAFVGSLDAHNFTSAEGEDAAHWGTPTLPAVQGALTYLDGFQAANLDHKVFLLLATDGQPSNLCTGNNIDGIAMALAAAAAKTPPIQTFIIGIGEVARLNALAMAGGTGHDAFIVDAGGTTTQAQFTSALEAIRHTALPCEYDIPKPASGRIDPDKVNVDFTTGGGKTTMPHVANMGACAADKPTWYYDDPTAPKQVIMCPAACESLKAGNGRIDLAFGCKTVVN